MNTGIEAVTTATLRLALDASAMRQQAIAANIANAGTVGYTPVRLSFEDQLGQLRAALRDHEPVDALALTAVQPRMVAAEGDAVELDVEAAHLAENTVRYQALIKGLNRHLSILGTAVSDGRR